MADETVSRRTALKSAVILAAAGAAAASCSPKAEEAAAPAPVAAPTPVDSTVAHPILLYCDLKVDPAREQEMLDAFHDEFKPVGATHKGFIDLKMLKLRTLIQGDKLPDAVNYRFQLTYENEELRQIWINSDDHKRVWPLIENTLTDKNFHVSLWDDV